MGISCIIVTGPFLSNRDFFTNAGGAEIGNKSDQLPPGGDLSFNLNYLTVPLLFRVSAGKSNKFFANAGPYVSWLFHESTNYIPENGQIFQVADETKYYQPVDAGFIFGIGISIPLSGNFDMSVEARDHLGLTNIRKGYSEFELQSYFLSVKPQGYLNSVLVVVGVGYRFKSSK